MAAAAIIMPYLLSMLLGRTIDLKNYEIGSGIYDDESYVEKQIAYMNASYHVLQSKTFPYDSFGMPIDVVLKIKANYLSSSSGALGLDGLLKDTTWMHNSAVIAVTAVYNTLQRSLSDQATLLDSWKSRIPPTQTHYASSMVYGGWFVVLYRFKCDVPSDVDSVRKTIMKILGTTGSLKDANVAEQWLKVQNAVSANKDVRGLVTIETSVYSSVKLPFEIVSPKTLLDAVIALPVIVGETGSPIYMELKPLSELDNSYPTVERSGTVVEVLSKIDHMLDDVQSTRTNVVRWIRDSVTIFDDDEEDMISDLLDTLSDCLRQIFALVDGLSLYKEVDKAAFDKIFNIYKKGLGKAGGTYSLLYLRLKEDIDAYCESTFLHGIKGLLNVYEGEKNFLGEVGSKGIKDCMMECIKEPRCRSIGYSDKIEAMDLSTGNYVVKVNQCWLYYRSTSTADIETPLDMYGDIRVYDQKCF